MPALLFALLASALLAGCSKLTVENVDRLKTGMPYEEVVGIIGKPASCDEALGLRNCTWGDEERSLNATFAAGKLVVVTGSRNLR
ncbi:hypothetical protein [Caldimonas sp. KR1-144]|uniref:hypothetical protein n=1 Tax=Caldimonas sp. KR1-144 TaxID=3400911 RepID=UPI003BFD14E5